MLRSLTLAVILAASLSAQFDPPGSALKTCLANSTTGKDRKDLAKWIFLAISAHPDMKQFVTSDAATAAEDSSRATATLVVRLLTESCVNEAKAVIRSGQTSQAMQVAFGGLGELAIRELVVDKSVQDSVRSLERYTDQRRLLEVLASK
jgi:hypothetical protein